MLILIPVTNTEAAIDRDRDRINYLILCNEIYLVLVVSERPTVLERELKCLAHAAKIE